MSLTHRSGMAFVAILLLATAIDAGPGVRSVAGSDVRARVAPRSTPAGTPTATPAPTATATRDTSVHDDTQPHAGADSDRNRNARADGRPAGGRSSLIVVVGVVTGALVMLRPTTRRRQPRVFGGEN